jgi:hypothetical protein
MNKLTILAVCACLVLASCTLGTGSGGASSSSKKASIVVSFSLPSSKTIVAAPSDYAAAIATLDIALFNSSGAQAAGLTGISYSSSVTQTFSGLAPDTYTITVNAKNSSSVVIATGSSSADATASGIGNVTVPLSFGHAGASTGGFSLIIAWPTTTILPYVYAKLDSATASAFFTLTSTSSPYTATIAKSGLSSGSHLLYIYFAASSAAATVIGPFIETVNIWDGVTSTGWIDGSGTLQSTRSFDSSEFASSNVNLASLSCVNADASSLSLSPAFTAGTTSYSLSTHFTGTSISFTATAEVGSQNLSCFWNGTSQSWSSVDGATYTFTATGLALVSGTNMLKITVTAPDRQTTQTYTVGVQCGAAGITISAPTVTPTTYQGLIFPSSATVVQGQAFALETSNSTLDAIPSGWTWYFNGTVDNTQTSQRFVLVPATTISMLGSYSISAAVTTSSGISYSGRVLLTVERPTALNLTSPTANPITLTASDGATIITQGTPYDLCYCSGKLYMADSNNHRILVANTDGSGASVLAGGTSGNVDGTGTGASFGFPFSLACDGKYLYVGDTTNSNIRKIALATGVVTKLATTGFSEPSGLWTDGVTLYMCDRTSNLVSAIDITNGTVTPLTAASFNKPYRICGDGSNLYVTEYGSGAVRKIVVASTVVTTIASGYNHPAGITYDGTDLYLCDADNSSIARLTLGGASTTILTGLNYPKGITTDDSKIYIEDTNINVVRVIQ